VSEAVHPGVGQVNRSPGKGEYALVKPVDAPCTADDVGDGALDDGGLGRPDVSLVCGPDDEQAASVVASSAALTKTSG
jgi:hypothetical protein